MSSIQSIVSGKSAVTDITTASERSTNTTSTTSGASTIQEGFHLRNLPPSLLPSLKILKNIENHKSSIQNAQRLMRWMSNQKQVRLM